MSNPRVRTEDHLLPPATSDTGGLVQLVREVASDAGTLVRQEVALAKLELKQAMAATTLDAVKIVVALGLAALGGLCMIIFMILGLGVLLDGAYWAGALITGVILLLAGGLLSLGAISDLKQRGLKPERTAETLREDARLAKREARALKEHVSRGLETGARVRRED